MTIGIEHVNDYRTSDSVRDSIRTEISDSQVPIVARPLRDQRETALDRDVHKKVNFTRPLTENS